MRSSPPLRWRRGMGFFVALTSWPGSREERTHDWSEFESKGAVGCVFVIRVSTGFIDYGERGSSCARLDSRGRLSPQELVCVRWGSFLFSSQGGEEVGGNDADAEEDAGGG